MFKEEKTPKYKEEHPKEDGRKNPKSTALRGLASMDKKVKEEVLAKAHKATSEAAKKRRSMANMFEEALTIDRRRSIAESLVFALSNGTVKISDRIRILELILRLTGELPGGTTKTEIEALGDVVLKIN